MSLFENEFTLLRIESQEPYILNALKMSPSFINTRLNFQHSPSDLFTLSEKFLVITSRNETAKECQGQIGYLLGSEHIKCDVFDPLTLYPLFTILPSDTCIGHEATLISQTLIQSQYLFLKYWDDTVKHLVTIVYDLISRKSWKSKLVWNSATFNLDNVGNLWKNVRDTTSNSLNVFLFDVVQDDWILKYTTYFPGSNHVCTARLFRNFDKTMYIVVKGIYGDHSLISICADRDPLVVLDPHNQDPNTVESNGSKRHLGLIIDLKVHNGLLYASSFDVDYKTKERMLKMTIRDAITLETIGILSPENSGQNRKGDTQDFHFYGNEMVLFQSYMYQRSEYNSNICRIAMYAEGVTKNPHYRVEIPIHAKVSFFSTFFTVKLDEFIEVYRYCPHFGGYQTRILLDKSKDTNFLFL